MKLPTQRPGQRLPDHFRMINGSIGTAFGPVRYWRCTCGAAELATSERTGDTLWTDHAGPDAP